MNSPENQTPFEIEKSPIKEAYLLLGASNPWDLSDKYSVEDQKWMSVGWDYKNQDHVVSKVRSIIEPLYPDSLDGEERQVAQNILWFWYHHAISSAVWMYKDRAVAESMALKALELQPEDHPNKITKLLLLVVQGNFDEARKWSDTITVDYEKQTAEDLIREFSEKDMFA